jgi:hypothetical protein
MRDMFLIDIPCKGCQGRSNRLSIVHAVSYFACGVNDKACTMHAVSMTPHAFLIFLHTIAVLHMIFTFCVVRKFCCACGINDTACIVHAVSMTPDAF